MIFEKGYFVSLCFGAMDFNKGQHRLAKLGRNKGNIYLLRHKIIFVLKNGLLSKITTAILIQILQKSKQINKGRQRGH